MTILFLIYLATVMAAAFVVGRIFAEDEDMMPSDLILMAAGWPIAFIISLSVITTKSKPEMVPDIEDKHLDFKV